MDRVDDEHLLAALAALGTDHMPALAEAGRALGRDDAARVLTANDGVAVADDHVRFGPDVVVSPDIDPALLALAARAAGEHFLVSGAYEDAGQMAIVADLPGLMRGTIRAALRIHPPAVSPLALRTWRDSAVLEPDDPHAQWIEAACTAATRAPQNEIVTAYEAVRQAFEDTGDLEAEVSVGLAAAVHARRADDLATLARYAARAEGLVAEGREEATAVAVLGRALRHQIMGESVAALAALDTFPADRAAGDWAAQVWMMRGTNLMLLGRFDAAIAAISTATGHGSAWTYAVALELLGTARWHAGDAVGGIADLRWAQATALAAGGRPTAELAAHHRGVLEAAHGHTDADRTDEAPLPASAGGEFGRLAAVAEVLATIDAGQLDEARALAAQLPVPDRAVRSAHWITSLQAALTPERLETLDQIAAVQPSLGAALAAGRAGAEHLAGGRRAPASARPFLPGSWCEPVPPVVEVDLLGTATIRIDGRAVTHPDWERSRVRELCLHLALAPMSSRELIAARLWPDRDPSTADRNLRVTLTYLLNVLDPSRPKGARSDLITTSAGLLGFAPIDRLRIDLQVSTAHAEAVCHGVVNADDATLVRAARGLLRCSAGPLLGGAVAADWLEPHDHDRQELMLRAATLGGPRLALLGHHDLAAELASRGLDEDPWAERLHQVVARAALARDDLDGARRALRRALSALDELGVEPEPATVDLAALVGLDPAVVPRHR